MKKLLISFLSVLIVTSLHGQNVRDELVFGSTKSESRHDFVGVRTESYIGGMQSTARRMLPPVEDHWEGGTMSFRMKVDPIHQNYFTVRCFGSESDKNLTMLFIEGMQVGYRHLGDIDYVTLGNGNAPLLGRFYYVTLPLPLKYTKGKSVVQLELRSYGPMWGYGSTFERYQQPMTKPTIGFYKAYTHIESYLAPGRKEVQGKAPVYKVRAATTEDSFVALKSRVNRDMSVLLNKDVLSQLEMWTLAEASTVSWTNAFENDQVVPLIAASIDAYYERFVDNPTFIYQDNTVYNTDWLQVGPIARAIRLLWDKWGDQLTEERINKWTDLLQAGLDYSIHHRRQYTNQSMIIDLFMYDVNKAVMLLEPTKAYPEYTMLRYLHESVGLAPWSGILDAFPLGTDYWQLTAKGLTKELGYVGYYGEVLDWVNDIYRSTCVTGIPNSGDLQIREQLLKMMEARSYFRHPGVDHEGNAVMRIEAVVGWRDGGHYPGDVAYCDRGTAWDATPLMTAANTLDPRAVGMVQQMIREEQFFPMIREKLTVGGMRGTRSLIHIPDEYDRIMKQPVRTFRMPMTLDGPDVVFSDEENGVVAIKNGDEILYASLYWRARNAVNNLAKVHFITPQTEHVSNVCIRTIIDDSGMRYTRPNWVNLGFNGSREWYKGIQSAHAGEVLPIARIPDGVRYKQGDENIFAGKALFYEMRYGRYLIGMNHSSDQTYTLTVPTKEYTILNGNPSETEVSSKEVQVLPMSTIVIVLETD
ncbi:MAG: hypothetical protein PHN20_10210 [Bacteroidales bacterium]|nr:hypothetical protein [Bacteroidales bacterium]